MKNAFKKWFSYLITFGLGAIASAASLIPYFVVNNEKSWPKTYISYSLLLGGVILAGVGFIIQDIYRATRRKATNNWDYPLEQQDINKAWLIFLPCLLSGLISFIAGLISYLFLR